MQTITNRNKILKKIDYEITSVHIYIQAFIYPNIIWGGPFPCCVFTHMGLLVSGINMSIITSRTFSDNGLSTREKRGNNMSTGPTSFDSVSN